MRIRFPYYQLELDLPAGTTVHEACHIAGYPLNTACGGTGLCGKCLAVIRHNGMTAQVLACQQLISPDMEILISPNHREEKLLTETAVNASFVIDPLVRFYPIAKHNLIAEAKEKGETVFDTLNRWFPVTLSELNYHTNRELNHSLTDPMPLMNLLTIPSCDENKESVLQIQSADDLPALYGLAFDIGTTSVAGYLLELEDGWLLASHGELNAQVSFGSDVISRIQTVKQNPETLSDLCRTIWQTLSEITKILCEKTGIKADQIVGITYCGNSVMTELLCCNDPQFLGESPFLLANKTGIQWTSNHLSCINDDQNSGQLTVSDICCHYILPGIGGYIGSDTTAVLLTLPDDDQLRLMIDLGTNCEIALGKNSTYTITSAACGPAFEGADIHMGMRSRSGAIEHCRFSDNHFIFDIIDGDSIPASGICGSGLIDCIAVFLKTGIIQSDGCFCEILPENLKSLSKRFGITEKGEKYFTLLFPEENQHAANIILTQKDIRELQLAIAAIRTGWQKLLSNKNYDKEKLSSVMLSGAFGSSVDLENAKKIGLIPDLKDTPVFTLGNGAGAGVQQALLSRDAIKKAKAVSEKSTVINLTDCPDFNEMFLKNLSFHPVYI